jgi:hypothetical protein
MRRSDLGSRSLAPDPLHHEVLPDAARLATVETVESPGRPVRIRVIDAADGWVLNDVRLIGSRVTAVAFGPDGMRLVPSSYEGTEDLGCDASLRSSLRRTTVGLTDRDRGAARPVPQ